MLTKFQYITNMKKLLQVGILTYYRSSVSYPFNRRTCPTPPPQIKKNQCFFKAFKCFSHVIRSPIPIKIPLQVYVDYKFVIFSDLRVPKISVDVVNVFTATISTSDLNDIDSFFNANAAPKDNSCPCRQCGDLTSTNPSLPRSLTHRDALFGRNVTFGGLRNCAAPCRSPYFEGENTIQSVLVFCTTLCALSTAVTVLVFLLNLIR
jgi:hypothetical protein